MVSLVEQTSEINFCWLWSDIVGKEVDKSHFSLFQDGGVWGDIGGTVASCCCCCDVSLSGDLPIR